MQYYRGDRAGSKGMPTMVGGLQYVRAHHELVARALLMLAPGNSSEGDLPIRLGVIQSRPRARIVTASASRHVLNWNAATWERTGHAGQGLSPRSLLDQGTLRVWTAAANQIGFVVLIRHRALGWEAAGGSVSLSGHCLVHAHAQRHRVPPSPAGRQADHSCALPLGGKVAKLEGLAAREPQPEWQVVLQTSIVQGHEGALTRLQVSATLEGPLCLSAEGNNDEGFV
ncbi:hypothetical protein J7T55_006764 [Diaporthe amygdali]|uniref:uncharacterized protein n=1 Tax=Phomopsis amygdali TaxID=1214568 RepID=UPI0022FDF6FF|nr:uncharacterized protein J7T55_006764 [Diaporthe amygdali]KAJ0125418.1 hypothetical protein J7T55_006764 [Diaporthe amygdali]